ncbi:MAG TPA: PQQ-binding-like beta-propeller repeat protein [Streptosporangiaceae bacterium]
MCAFAVTLAAGAAILPSAGPARAGASTAPQLAAVHRHQALAAASQDWPAYLFSASHPSATTGPATITPGNAGSLQAAWTFQQQPPTGAGQPQGGFSASPTVSGGMVFIGSQTGDLYALQEATGQVVWQRTLDYEQVGNNGNCKNTRGIVGTATVAADPQTGKPTVYVPGARYLYALDAATGTQEWKSLVGPANSAAVVGAYYNYASPTVANGNVYEGVSSSCNNPFVRGGVQSFSQQTGALQHSFWTVSAGQVGASVWSSEAATQNWVWATTGDPEFTGTSLFHAYSVVRLNASTLTLSGSWQLKLPQASDLDFGSSPTLFSGTINGVSTSLAGACNKNGIYYALQRNALASGPVWTRRISHMSDGTCLASAVWNARASQLYLAASVTTIKGTTYNGGVRAVNASTGAVQWGTGLGCNVLGTPALDAATGVLAVATWSKCHSGSSPAVYLLNAATGDILGTLPLTGGGFAQPVFAGQYLLVADESGQLVAYTPAATAGQARCTGWCGARHRQPRVPPVPAP